MRRHKAPRAAAVQALLILSAVSLLRVTTMKRILRRELYFFFCTFAATLSRSAFSRMKPVASSWLQSLVGSASIVGIRKNGRNISGKVNRTASFSEPFSWVRNNRLALAIGDCH